ncbi:uncharacterized protein PFLUO_LOCUS613 [Penicillium psychrofluorescens]|uniref:uncharacterized protein n=1 Tax=Penicillium psychrofluorescens TaxID=3158075 RepID=UPI003CCDB505
MASTKQLSYRHVFLILALYLITISRAAFIEPKVPDAPTLPEIDPPTIPESDPETIPESDPETIPDTGPEPEDPTTDGGSDGPLVGIGDPSYNPETGTSDTPGGTDHTPLFADEESLEEYSELFDDITDLLSAIESATSSSAATFSHPASIPATRVIAVRTPEPAAATADPTLGCNIFTSYMSICAPTTSATASSSFLDVRATDWAFASCACYSSTYWVPDALDSAAGACAGYTTATGSAVSSGDLAAAATTASRMELFCQSMSNVRNQTSTQFGAVTPTASPSSSVSPSSVHSGSNGNGAGVVRVEPFGLACVAALIMVLGW